MGKNAGGASGVDTGAEAEVEEVVETGAEEGAEGTETPAEGDPAAEGAEEGAEGAAEGEEGAGAAAAGAYTPNLTFKVHGKVHKFPDYLKSVVKDAKSEKEVRAILEKSEGLFHVKQRAEGYKGQLEQLGEKHEQLSDFFVESREMRDEGDFDGLFEKWGIPVKAVAQWLKDKLEENDLPPGERQRYNRSREDRSERRTLSRTAQRQQQQLFQREAELRELQLETLLSQPKVSSLATRYDEAMGEEGAFQSLVIEHSIARHAQDGTDLSAKQAVTEVMAKIAKLLPGTAGAGNGGGGNADGGQGGGKPPKTLPKVAGSQASPTKRRVKSIADLKKISEEKLAEAD